MPSEFRRMLLCACLTVALDACLSAGIAYAEFFVAPGGNDAAAGTASAPWQTLQYAANQVGPGDRVTVRAGNYAGFQLTTSGLAGSPIEFIADAEVVVDTPNATTPDGINLEGASHVVIDGFAVRQMPRAGVRTVGPVGGFADFVTIRHVEASDNGVWGIFSGFVHDLLIEENRTSGSQDEHGIYVSNSGDRPVIRRNEIWNNHANGIHMNGDASLGGDGVISGAIVSQNRIYNNGAGGGSGINMDGVVDSRIENNLLYDNHASGLSLYQIDGGAPSTGNVVINNTIHQASDGRWALNIQDGSTDNVARNNILISEHSFRGAIDISADSRSGLVSDFNVVIDRFTSDDSNTILTLADWQTETGNDWNSRLGNADALFTDWQAGDYNLRADSVARDAGSALDAPAVDLLGASRPSGTGHDIGALEFRDVAADLDNDGDVDGNDFLLIQRSNRALISLWKTEFGSGMLPLAASQSIPEPHCVTLLGCAGLLLALARR